MQAVATRWQGFLVLTVFLAAFWATGNAGPPGGDFAPGVPTRSSMDPVLVAVDSISLTSNWFSPNGDSLLEAIGFHFHVQGPGRAVVQVASPGLDDTLATVLDTLVVGSQQLTGGWNGLLDGVKAPDGLYDFRFSVTDTLLNTTSNRRQFGLDTVFPRIDSLQIEPRPYTPTLSGSPQEITVRFRISQSQIDDEIGVEIVQGASVHPVATLGGFNGDGFYAAPCRTCADSLQDGMATIRVTAWDRAANQSTWVDSVDTNLDGPKVTLTHPTASEFVTLRADSIVGRAVDRQIVNKLSMLVSGSLDTTLSLMATPGADSTELDFRVDVSQLFAAEGVYELSFPAGDVDGVADSTRMITYTVDQTAPPRPILSPALPSEIRAMEVTARVLVDSTAYQLLIAGAAIPWEPTPINGKVVHTIDLPLAPGLNTLTFRVVDIVGNESAAETTSVFRLTTQGLSVEERFHAGGSISIDAGVVANGVQVRILALDGSLVRLFENGANQREYIFTWDLTTPEGRRVRNGAYLVVARVDLPTSTQRYRKMIAVIE